MPPIYAKQYRRRRYKAFKKKYIPKASVSVRNGSFPVAKTSGTVKGLYQDASRYINKAYQGYSTAMKAYKLGSLAVSMLNAEKKYYDIAATAVTPTTPGGATPIYVSLVDAIPLGDGPNNRDGSQLRLKSAQVLLTAAKAAAATTTVLRWAIFLDTRPQPGSTPSYTDLYDTSNVVQTFVNIEDQWKRFRIIRSDTVILDSEDSYKTVEVYIPCSLPVRYDTNNDVIMNNMWLMLISSETTNAPTVNYRYRVRFYDN